MPTVIRMPPLSAGAEDAKLLSWLRREGDTVREGEEIAEVETDKATMAIEAPHDGIISSILVPASAPAVRVDTAIALLLRDDESAPVPDTSGTAARPAAADISNLSVVAGAGVSTLPVQQAPGNRTPASPLARRLARDRNLDIAAIEGTGPRGRIVRADVERAARTDGNALLPEFQSIAQQTPAVVVASTRQGADATLRTFAGRGFHEIPLDRMRRTIAERLTLSKQTVPHYYLRRDLRVDGLLDLRAQLNEQLADIGLKLSVNDFFIRACALALQQLPDCNAIWAGDSIVRLEASDIAVAVSVEGGLYTPVLRDVHTKSISILSREIRALAKRARERKLRPDECEGGSMTISNLGMHGVENFDAVINPPQVAILAVGAATKKMIFDDVANSFVGVRVTSVTLSVDHRVLDGALGAALLNAIAQNIENPLATIA